MARFTRAGYQSDRTEGEFKDVLLVWFTGINENGCIYYKYPDCYSSMVDIIRCPFLLLNVALEVKRARIPIIACMKLY